MFWTDAPDTAAIETMMTSIMGMLGRDKRLRPYALLDPAVCPSTVRAALAGLAARPMPLYEGIYHGPGLDQVDPLIVPLDEGELHRICRTCAGVPALGILLAGDGPRSLRDVLRCYMEATAADGTVFLLRWADTRALPTLHAVLDGRQRRALDGGIRAWRYFDRAGNAASLPLPGQAAASDVLEPVDKLRLGLDQLVQLQTAMLPDLMLDFLRTHPHVYGRFQPGVSPSRCHTIAREALASDAGRAGADDLQDAARLTLVRDALATQGFLA